VQAEEIRYRGTGEIVAMPTYRLYLSLHFVPPESASDWRPRGQLDQLRRFDAIVDTGAQLSCLPFEIWEPFESEIQWLTTVPERQLIRLAGVTTEYRLGRILLGATDTENRWLPPTWIVARCCRATDLPFPSLLGLTSSLLMSERRIRHQASTSPSWWLEER
jgi:hypothetical protein